MPWNRPESRRVLLGLSNVEDWISNSPIQLYYFRLCKRGGALGMREREEDGKERPLREIVVAQVKVCGFRLSWLRTEFPSPSKKSILQEGCGR